MLTANGVATNLIAGRWRAAEAIGEIELICVQLLEELALRASSRWADWLSTLPATYDVPALWDAPARAALRCPVLCARVEEERASIEASFATIVRIAAKRSLPLPLNFSLPLFLWAYATVRTRGATILSEHDEQPVDAGAAAMTPVVEGTNAIDGGGASDSVTGVACVSGSSHWAICPLGDMFNHTGDALTRCYFDRASKSYRYEAGEAIAAGEAVCVCYGAHDDGTLLEQYGFVLPGNPHACVQLGTACELPEHATAWLEEQGMAAEHHVTADGASWELMAALRLKHSTEDERALGGSFALLEGEPVSDANERLALTELQRLVLAHSEAVGSALVADAATAAGEATKRIPAAPSLGPSAAPQPDEHSGARAASLAEAWLVAQRRILAACLANVEQKLASCKRPLGATASAVAGSTDDAAAIKRSRRR
eukprot:3021142-Prymnesium_polylepis.1